MCHGVWHIYEFIFIFKEGNKEEKNFEEINRKNGESFALKASLLEVGNTLTHSYGDMTIFWIMIWLSLPLVTPAKKEDVVEGMSWTKIN